MLARHTLFFLILFSISAHSQVKESHPAPLPIDTVIKFKQELKQDTIIMGGRILPYDYQTTSGEFFTRGYCHIKTDNPVRKISVNSMFRVISYDLGSNWENQGPEIKALILANSEMTIKLRCLLGYRVIRNTKLPKANNSAENIRSVMQTLLEFQ